MKKRVLFLFACFITFILVFALQKPVFMLYNHASGGGLSISDYLQGRILRKKPDSALVLAASIKFLLFLFFLLFSDWVCRYSLLFLSPRPLSRRWSSSVWPCQTPFFLPSHPVLPNTGHSRLSLFYQ